MKNTRNHNQIIYEHVDKVLLKHNFSIREIRTQKLSMSRRILLAEAINEMRQESPCTLTYDELARVFNKGREWIHNTVNVFPQYYG